MDGKVPHKNINPEIIKWIYMELERVDGTSFSAHLWQTD